MHDDLIIVIKFQRLNYLCHLLSLHLFGIPTIHLKLRFKTYPAFKIITGISSTVDSKETAKAKDINNLFGQINNDNFFLKNMVSAITIITM